MVSNPKLIIEIATNAELLNEHYYKRLWLASRNLNLPRRKWLDEIANCFLNYEGMIHYPSGDVFPIPFVDEVFGDDLDMRWLSYYLRADQSGEAPFSQTRKLERIRLIDLYFRIEHPNLARHFGR